MKRKGQAGWEFLMTYGWAMLVILIALFALLYFLNPLEKIEVIDNVTNAFDTKTDFSVCMSDCVNSESYRYNSYIISVSENMTEKYVLVQSFNDTKKTMKEKECFRWCVK